MPAKVQEWPKVLSPLTPEQEVVYDDFVKRWHEILPQRYGLVERFNHSFPVKHSRSGFGTTLEIGAGLGEHLRYEDLTPEQEAEYYALELRQNMAARLAEVHPRVQAMIGDCQQRLEFPDGYFDRYVAVHVLEHLPDLPACIREAWRLLDKQRGQFLAVIPCEGGMAYSLARRISAQRVFERTYRMSYRPFIEREHINRPVEILRELAPYFVVEHRRFFPLRFVPRTSTNLCIGLAMRPRATPSCAEAPGSAARQE
ncbi:MAG: class I SAM-dependent methyltransferase [Solirubrobacteraceae bacterium]